MTIINTLKVDVEEHGEVHAVVEEIDEGEVEIRQGTTTFDEENDVVHIDDGQTTHTIGMDRIVYWYKPMDFLHEH